LASTHRLHRSLDGLPQILEFQRSRRVQRRPKRSLRQKRMKQEDKVAKLTFEQANYILTLKYLYGK